MENGWVGPYNLVYVQLSEIAFQPTPRPEEEEVECWMISVDNPEKICISGRWKMAVSGFCLPKHGGIDQLLLY